jgi:RNA polymerase-binding transcription factor DksA
LVQFLNATQTFGEIQSIINQAKNGTPIVMISPYIKVNDLILSRLIDAATNRNVVINMICREDDLKPDERTRLEQIPNLNLASDEHVHAKCFYNDDCMVIGSLNLYDTSAGNHEMGVLLRNDSEGDKIAFQAAKNEAQFILRNAKKHLQSEIELNPKKRLPHNYNQRYESNTIKNVEEKISERIPTYKATPSNPKIGHCIHCGIAIDFNRDSPYCTKCWKNWNRYKNRNFPEDICHLCGQTAKTSMNEPLCHSCNIA